MNKQQCKQLDEQSYLIFRNLLSPVEIQSILARLEELWSAEGDHAGEENYIEPGVRRPANLANKGELFHPLYAHPQVLEVVEAVMGPDLRADVPRPENRRQHLDADQSAALPPRERELLGLDDE